MHINIARSLIFFGAAVCAAMLVSIGIGAIAFNNLRVNGPVYQRIVDGKDLVADILPPPLYVVESYMLALEAAQRREAAPDHLARIFNTLKADYATRREYWQKSALEPELKEQLLGKVVPAGDAFWTVMETGIRPALEAGGEVDLSKPLRDLHDAFVAHDAEVNRLVKAALAFQTQTESAAADATRSFTIWSLAAAAASILILCGGLTMLQRRAIVPLNGLRDYMAVLANGDYTKPVPHVTRADEIGEMARAVTVFREAALERMTNRKQREADQAEKLEQERRQHAERAAEDAQRAQVIAALSVGLERLARGDVTVRIEERFAGEYEKLRDEFNASMASLSQALGDIAAATSTIKTGAGEILSGTDDLSRRTETQATSLEQAAAAIKQITVGVRNSSNRATEAGEMMATARRSAANSSLVVGEAVAAMEMIAESSNQIGQIIGLIDGIAFQTNLLALNAGVEAARAGEAGKGFTVVAQEVRELAGRSASAAREIKQLIAASSDHVSAGVSQVNRTGTLLAEIETQINQVNGLIEWIIGSSREQASALGEVNAAVNTMDQMTQQNVAMVEETNAACEALSAETERLHALLARFNVIRTGQAARIELSHRAA